MPESNTPKPIFDAPVASRITVLGRWLCLSDSAGKNFAQLELTDHIAALLAEHISKLA